MKLKSMWLVSLTAIVSLSVISRPSGAITSQSGTLYQQMTLTQRAALVTGKAREISRKMSGNDYEFTTAFEMEIQKAVDAYRDPWQEAVLPAYPEQFSGPELAYALEVAENNG